MFYSERKEVEFANAIDAAMTFIKGTGHQMELEAIRGRVREALRARVRGGRIAGGRCYGYDLRREKDSSGREYTIAVVNESEAEIVRRIFREYLNGKGLKRIAVRLNDERVAPPRAGRRGTGSWCPNAIRAMLRNGRYRGVYTHGKTVRVRRGAKRIASRAPAEDVITVEAPEWRIIDDATWFAVQDSIGDRAAGSPASPGPCVRYALSALGRCAHCGGSIGTQTCRVKSKERVKVYGCSRHHVRGNAVCPVKLRQPIEEVEAAVADHILKHWLTADLVVEVLTELRANLTAQLKATAIDVEATEAELARLRAEQRNLASAVAAGGDAIPELLAELRNRNDRIRTLDIDLASARRTPAMVKDILAKAETAARRKLHELRAALATPGDAREVFEALFLPEGLEFTEAWNEDRTRRVWAVSATAHPARSILESDPTGVFAKLKPLRREFRRRCARRAASR